MPLFHLILVAAFLSVTATLFGLTVYQRLSISDTLLSWRVPRMGAAWPVTFVGVIGLLALYAVNTGGTVPGWVFAGYAFGGILWFASTVLASSVVVSRHGIVTALGRREATLPWCQVSDHFETIRGRKTHMVFLYQTEGLGTERLEVVVPDTHLPRLRLIVSERLEQRQIRSSTRVPGRRATS